MADAKPESKLIRDLKAARRAGVPIIGIETADPAACIRQIKGPAKDVPLVRWDRVDGFTPLNDLGAEVLREALGEDPDQWSVIKDFHLAVRKMKIFPGKEGKRPGTMTFVLNAQHNFNIMTQDYALNIQSIWNLRDEYKRNHRTLVLLGPEFTVPTELKNDLLVLDDPLPTPAELEIIVKDMYKAGGLSAPSDDIVSRSVEAVRGLSPFAAEQVVAMSITPQGIDLTSLWDRKKKTIELTPGLGIWRGKETYSDLTGIQPMKDYFKLLMEGEDAPTVVVFMDELEKQLSGTKGDLSGVSQEMHGQLLTWMADEEVPALLELGIQGCSKSFIAKCVGGQFSRPTILMNMSEIKGGIIGQSTAQMKGALKTISAIGRPLVVGACNDIDILSPELKDRFKLGTFYFDLPSEEEKKACWTLYIKKFKLAERKGISMEMPDDRGWTPRNIRDCCENAWRLRISPEQAGHYIVPPTRSSPERIKKLREMAHGKFLSASTGRIYVNEAVKKVEEGIRSIETGGPVGSA